MSSTNLLLSNQKNPKKPNQTDDNQTDGYFFDLVWFGFRNLKTDLNWFGFGFN